MKKFEYFGLGLELGLGAGFKETGNRGESGVKWGKNKGPRKEKGTPPFEVADLGLRRKRIEMALEARFGRGRVNYTLGVKKRLHGLKKGLRIDSGGFGDERKGEAGRFFFFRPPKKGRS